MKPIEGYEGRYSVTSSGEVYSHKNQYFLNPFDDGNGYKMVALYKGTRANKRMKVHRLVAFAFLKKRPEENVINHKDCNPANNNVENLEWCTHGYNIRYGFKMRGNYVVRGEMQGMAKLKEDDVREIRAFRERGLTYDQIAEKFNVHRTNIYQIAKRKTWTHI